MSLLQEMQGRPLCYSVWCYPSYPGSIPFSFSTSSLWYAPTSLPFPRVILPERETFFTANISNAEYLHVHKRMWILCISDWMYLVYSRAILSMPYRSVFKKKKYPDISLNLLAEFMESLLVSFSCCCFFHSSIRPMTHTFVPGKV